MSRTPTLAEVVDAVERAAIFRGDVQKRPGECALLLLACSALRRLDPDVPENVERVISVVGEPHVWTKGARVGRPLSSDQARAILKAIIGDGA